MSELDLALKVLDHQVIDRDGRRCGNVDDVEIEGGAGESPRVTALLIGPGYWPHRSRWVGRIAAFVGGHSRVRVPWEEVDDVESGVKLRKSAGDLGLGRGDDRLRPWIEKIPGAHR